MEESQQNSTIMKESQQNFTKFMPKYIPGKEYTSYKDDRGHFIINEHNEKVYGYLGATGTNR
jgi:hypothetical protein